jgi:hypothetical protein
MVRVLLTHGAPVRGLPPRLVVLFIVAVCSGACRLSCV